MLGAFSNLREPLCHACVLHAPSVSDSFELHSDDASGFGIDAVLNIAKNDSVVPAFHSH